MNNVDKAEAVESLPEPDEPPAVEVVNTEGRSSLVLVCDHASNRIPRRLGVLGLEPAQLSDHIAWDPGAAEVARRLATLLDAPLVLSGYSRLVVDCNRLPANPESIPEQSAGVSIPGNCGLTPQERDIRLRGMFWPYHRAIETLLDERFHRPSLLFSIHSFTAILDGEERPWPIGVSCGHDRRLARLMREALTQHLGAVVGDNEPYPIDVDVDYTIPVHGEGRGLPHVMIEIRQDGIRTTAGAATWAARLAEAFLTIEAEARAL